MLRTRELVFIAASTLIGLIFFAPSSFATMIAGNLVIADVGPMGVTLNFIDFDYPPAGPADGSGAGLFNILSGSAGSFAPLAGTQASIRDLNRAVTPVGMSVSDENFVTFSSPLAAGWSITLTELLPGIDSFADCTNPTPAPGQTCTPNIPGGSPFNLQNTTSSSSTLSFTFIGIAHDVAEPGVNSNVLGLFSSTFSNDNLQQIVGALGTGGTLVTSNSGTITATLIPSNPVPEPGSLSMILLGLMAGCAAGRKKLHKLNQ